MWWIVGGRGRGKTKWIMFYQTKIGNLKSEISHLCINLSISNERMKGIWYWRANMATTSWRRCKKVKINLKDAALTNNWIIKYPQPPPPQLTWRISCGELPWWTAEAPPPRRRQWRRWASLWCYWRPFASGLSAPCWIQTSRDVWKWKNKK